MSSKTKNTALQAGMWYVISSIMVKMVSVVTTPFFTRLLSTDEYGRVATFSSWYAMFTILYTLNLTVSIGRAKLDYSDKLDQYIGSLQILSLCVSSVITAIILVFIQPISKFFELSVLETVLLCLYLMAAPVITFWQSGYRYKYLYKQNIAIAWYTVIGTVALSFALIKFGSADKGLMRMIGISLPSIILAIYFWIKTIKNRNASINITYWKYGLLISLPMVLHAISMNILSQSDRLVISKFCGATPVAFYSLVRNYALLLFVVTDAMNQAWQPWFHDNYYAKNYYEVRKNTKLIVILTCYIGLACIAIGPEAILILGGKQYMEAIKCLPSMVLGVVCQCIYTHYINIEIHLKKTKYASQGTVIAAILNIVLNIIFIPPFGYEAAAYTTFVSYCVLLILHYYITRYKLKVKIYDDRFMFIAMFITTIVSIIISLTYDSIIMRYGLIIIGLISFLIIFRNYLMLIKDIIMKFLKGRK